MWRAGVVSGRGVEGSGVDGDCGSRCTIDCYVVPLKAYCCFSQAIV